MVIYGVAVKPRFWNLYFKEYIHSLLIHVFRGLMWLYSAQMSFVIYSRWFQQMNVREENIWTAWRKN